MKIGIHDSGPGFFSERWIAYCKNKSIPYKIVDCYKTDIIAQLSDCDVLMWHHNQVFPIDVLISRQLLNALEATGKRIFPNFRTAWHFDDKLGQKYLLESMDAPIVPVYISFSKQEALNWAKVAEYPKVFKLRGGGGSKNVWLVKRQADAIRIINTAFGKGFRQYNARREIFEQYRKFRIGNVKFINLVKAAAHLILPTQLEKIKPIERGYVYFQNYLPGNQFDIRVIVVGNKAFAIKRLTRKGDFRASGSGQIVYLKNEIDIRCVHLAFQLNRVLNAQCVAYDFILDGNNDPWILEISYGFTAKAYDLCPGFWNDDLEWFEGPFNPYGWMIENLITELD